MSALSAILYVFAGIAVGFWCGCNLGYHFGIYSIWRLYHAGKLPKSFTEGRK